MQPHRIEPTHRSASWQISANVDAIVDGRELGLLGRARDTGADGIQVDVRHRGKEASFVEQSLGFKPTS